MPVPKITAKQFITNLSTDINNRNASYDTTIGPIADIYIRPTANALELQNDRIRQVSLLQTLQQINSFQDSDVDAFVYNESLIRLQGGYSNGTVTFSRAVPPTSNITVQQNFPISTNPDTATGQTVTFVTTVAATMVSANAASYFNIQTQRYELTVPVQATIAGSIGVVGANLITNPLRPMTGFDSVTNNSGTSSVSDVETSPDLIERFKISIIGTQLATTNGRKLFIESNFQDAGDVLVVTTGDPLITRSGINGGAVDIYIQGENNVAITENQTFVGINQLIVLDNQPVTSVTSVVGYTLGTDYIFVPDTSGVSGSSRSKDAIKFIPGGSSPAVGAAITVTYEYDILVSEIQNALNNADNQVDGQDPLVRHATVEPIQIGGNITVNNGFTASTVIATVQTALLSYVNGLGLGQNVEQFELNLIIGGVSGVGNFIFTSLDFVGGTGNADVVIAKNEYATLVASNINIVG